MLRTKVTYLGESITVGDQFGQIMQPKTNSLTKFD